MLRLFLVFFTLALIICQVCSHPSSHTFTLQISSLPSNPTNARARRESQDECIAHCWNRGACWGEKTGIFGTSCTCMHSNVECEGYGMACSQACQGGRRGSGRRHHGGRNNNDGMYGGYND